MKDKYSLKIDVFTHILTDKYREALLKLDVPEYMARVLNAPIPTMYDLDLRFRIMDKYEGLMQVLSITSPPVEGVADSEKSVDLAKLANDEMAELVSKYPTRFPAAVACLPMNNMEAALRETDRAINDLKFRGVQIYSPTNDKPIDAPEFVPLYQKMSEYNLPIFLHPWRTWHTADYKTEDQSHNRIFHMFGWPYETTAAMTRLVFSGILEKYPNLKFVTHHCGAMVPFFEKRIMVGIDVDEMVRGENVKKGLTKPHIEYFKMFYADTAIYGHTPGLMCGLDFFGVDHILFATDMPWDNQLGDRETRDTINSIEQMDISDLDKKKIFEDNAKKLMRLPL